MAERIVVADAHLEGLTHNLELFVSFLSSLQERQIHTLFILGDLFTIWLGTPKMQRSYQQPVLKAFQSLRNNGIRLIYVEGNRDYFLAPFYLNAPFHEIIAESTQENIGEKQIHFSHGDLVNIYDKQYRLWRAFSRSQMIYSAFRSLPRTFAIRFAHYLEQKFRETNLRNKGAFPEETCQRYAEHLWKAGNDMIVLGHFHEKRSYEFVFEDRKRHLYVLPAWKDTCEYLQISEQGRASFHQFTSLDSSLDSSSESKLGVH